MTSFLYPRTVSITRPGTQTGVGVQPYGGETPGTETPVANGLPASIQLERAKGKTDADLPGDAARTFWRVFIPAASAARGLIDTRDIVTDDLGQRYQVTAPYWNSLGHSLMVERLET